MYGKHFASMYTGSMYGKPALVFAAWGYVISHFRQSKKDGQCYVEIHPGMLAGIFSTTPQDVLDALAVLEAPDEASRSKEHEGRRLILLSDERVVGPLHYLVVNGAKYKAIRDEEDRREYLKEAQRISRARRKAASSTMSTAVNPGLPLSSHAEGDREREETGSLVAPGDVAERILGALNEATTRNYQAADGTLKHIRGRLRDGATEAECLAVIACKVSQWRGTEQWKYTRPSTLFAPGHFAEYLAEAQEAPGGREPVKPRPQKPTEPACRTCGCGESRHDDKTGRCAAGRHGSEDFECDAFLVWPDHFTEVT